MTDVILTVGGRPYAVACAAGEEGHIAELGKMIDDKLGTLPGAVARNAGNNASKSAGMYDSRSLLFAALLLADELHDLRQPQRDERPAPIAPAPDRASKSGELDRIAAPDQLAALAERLEALADAWETPV